MPLPHRPVREGFDTFVNSCKDIAWGLLSLEFWRTSEALCRGVLAKGQETRWLYYDGCGLEN